MEVKKLTGIENDIFSLFAALYDKNRAFECLDRLKELFSDYGHVLEEQKDTSREAWDETDAVLITYGDVVRSEEQPDKPYLQVLESVLNKYLNEIISTVHILPFFPSSSDAGFSVIDYKKVRKELGTWSDIERLAEDYRLMGDLVINHTSRFGEWFNNYQNDESPGKDYFIEVDPDEDLSATTRPRNSPLLTMVKTVNGFRHVWTTFSSDQIDLDFSNPDVLFEFIDIFLFYYSQGIRVFRFDAVAYLWKEIGTPSIHLPETHQVVKLFRDIADCIDPEITILTETNVPLEENLSYFGDQDEAHMIYQFSLPPLLLHAILTENARYLTDWASGLPELPEGYTFFNFTSSHDGIGMRPLEGLIPQEEFNYLIESTKERGGFISYKQNPQATQSPYELNITYFDAFEKPGHPRSDIQIKRYMCAQTIMLSLKGVPGLYFHTLTATKNDIEGVLNTGQKRAINRKQWERKELEGHIKDEDGATHYVLFKHKELLQKRKEHPAFHPSAEQDVQKVNDSVFAFIRCARDESETIMVISNVTDEKLTLHTDDFNDTTLPARGIRDLISEESVLQEGMLRLKPFQTMWLVL
jgi:sucrose phosphorylase